MSRLDEIRARLAPPTPSPDDRCECGDRYRDHEDGGECNVFKCSLQCTEFTSCEPRLLDYATVEADRAYLLAEIDRLQGEAEAPLRYHRCSGRLRRYPGVVCSLCRHAAIDFDPIEEIERLQGEATRVDADHDRAWKAIGDHRTGDLGHHIERVVRERDEARGEAERVMAAWLRKEPTAIGELCHRGCGGFPVGTVHCPECGRGLMTEFEALPETRSEIADAIERGEHRRTP